MLSSFFNGKMEESAVVLFITVYITSGKCQLKMKLILCMHFILLFPLTHGGNLKQYDSKTPSVN